MEALVPISGDCPQRRENLLQGLSFLPVNFAGRSARVFGMPQTITPDRSLGASVIGPKSEVGGLSSRPDTRARPQALVRGTIV